MSLKDMTSRLSVLSVGASMPKISNRRAIICLVGFLICDKNGGFFEDHSSLLFVFVYVNTFVFEFTSKIVEAERSRRSRRNSPLSPLWPQAYLAAVALASRSNGSLFPGRMATRQSDFAFQKNR